MNDIIRSESSAEYHLLDYTHISRFSYSSFPSASKQNSSTRTSLQSTICWATSASTGPTTSPSTESSTSTSTSKQRDSSGPSVHRTSTCSLATTRLRPGHLIPMMTSVTSTMTSTSHTSAFTPSLRRRNSSVSSSCLTSTCPTTALTSSSRQKGSSGTIITLTPMKNINREVSSEVHNNYGKFIRTYSIILESIDESIPYVHQHPHLFHHGASSMNTSGKHIISVQDSYGQSGGFHPDHPIHLP